MDCMGVWASGTAYITFEDVRVRTPWASGRPVLPRPSATGGAKPPSSHSGAGGEPHRR